MRAERGSEGVRRMPATGGAEAERPAIYASQCLRERVERKQPHE